jgi:hypothetical protein
MRDFIGAKNRPFVSEYRKDHLLNLVKHKCCVCIGNLPIDTTPAEVICLVNAVNIDVTDVFIPFNLLTQEQLPKAYVFLTDKYAACLLICRLKKKTLYNKPVDVNIHTSPIHF